MSVFLRTANQIVIVDPRSSQGPDRDPFRLGHLQALFPTLTSCFQIDLRILLLKSYSFIKNDDDSIFRWVIEKGKMRLFFDTFCEVLPYDTNFLFSTLVGAQQVSQKISCAHYPCRNGGRCTNMQNNVYGYQCDCVQPWTGRNCELSMKHLFSN
jgi:hypothetical protein